MLAQSARLYGLPGPEAFASQHPAGRLLDPAEVAAGRALLAGPAPRRAAGMGSGPDVTVLLPVRDRAQLLARCLAALGSGYPMIVVDDGSDDPAAVAAVAAAHGATLVRRPVTGGPGAARNTGLLGVTTDLVAFVDSDCEPGPGSIERLAAHLAHPAPAAAP